MNRFLHVLLAYLAGYNFALGKTFIATTMLSLVIAGLVVSYLEERHT
jgi:hypothetical protein